MVTIRLPRPTGVYVPNSPRSVTSDMISSPLSADFNFDSETLTPSIIPALEYISYKLQQKHMHVTLLVGRGKPYPTGQPSDLIVIPSTTLEPSVSRTLTRTIAKAAQRFSLGQSWSDALARSHHERHANEYLIERSILQNEVVFSREGLTLLNVDRIYTFKRRLCILSTSTSSNSKSKPTASPESYINSCVRLLHRTIEDFNGRPFSKAFFHRVYEQLDVSDELLSQVATVYKKQYSQDGIVMPPAPKPAIIVAEKKKPAIVAIEKKPAAVVTEKKPAVVVTEKKKTAVRPVRVRKAPTPAYKGLSPAGTLGKRGPKTPLSASDVTPITRNEWNLLFGPGFKKTQPTVTKWTPSPTALAAC
ncbi:hypothetical protein BDW74DRAFT_144737 [Aspergillus multicolor]|uniref:uncharacterized protein n=1 Tax=Aspergillus multicolor TaxID=41759 RepID=UPI003CCD3C83